MIQHAHIFPVGKMSKVLNVSASGYYYWRKNPIPKRKLQDMKLIALIKEIHQNSNKTYGSPRITTELQLKGHGVSVKRVARLMRENGIRSRVKRRFKVTTNSKHNFTTAPNLVKQDFRVDRKTQVWVSDITYIKTAKGWVYLTIIMDLYDRKIIGWNISGRMDTKHTTLPAWRMAVKNRPVNMPLVFHSDRGVQYASNQFKKVIAANSLVKQSMSRKGNCYDNAVAESFFKSLKVEWIYPKRLETKNQAAIAIFQYIEAWYNRNRRHSALGGLTIEEFEHFNQLKLSA